MFMRVQESLKTETTKFKTDSMTFCTKFFCFRDFSVPNFFENGSDTFFGTKKNRDQFRDFFRYQIFFETDSGTFFGTKIFRYRFRDFFRYQIFFETGSGTFFGTKFFRYRFRYHQKKTQIPGNGNSRDRDVTLWPEGSESWETEGHYRRRR